MKGAVGAHGLPRLVWGGVALLRWDERATAVMHMRCGISCSSGFIAFAKALRHNKSLLEVEFSGNIILDDGASALASTLAVNASLHTADLSVNMIGDKGVQALAAALKCNTSLTRLLLSFNRFEEQGMCMGCVGCVYWVCIGCV